jgi:hypothetical protein
MCSFRSFLFDTFLCVRYIVFTIMKKPKQTKRSTAEKAVENPATTPQAPIQPAASKPAAESVSLDPERDEVAFDEERGEEYHRKTPMGMLEEAEAEANQRELADYHDTILLLRQKGFSFREIGEFLSKRGVFADHNAVYRVYTKHMTPEEMEEENRIQEEEREQEMQQ